MGMIKLPNMRFYTYNGVFDEEKKAWPADFSGCRHSLSDRNSSER